MSDGYRITIVAPTRRKYPTKLRTYRWDETGRRWVGDLSAYMSKSNIHAGNLPGGLLRKPFMSGHRNMKMVHISKNCDVPFTVVSVVCDALRAGGLHTVSVGDMKAINSQYGSRIAKLESLSGEERRHATTALHRLILDAVLDSPH
jgi:hypothetical protein